jgi:hypothetical protein
VKEALRDSYHRGFGSSLLRGLQATTQRSSVGHVAFKGSGQWSTRGRGKGGGKGGGGGGGGKSHAEAIGEAMADSFKKLFGNPRDKPAMREQAGWLGLSGRQ